MNLTRAAFDSKGAGTFVLMAVAALLFPGPAAAQREPGAAVGNQDLADERPGTTAFDERIDVRIVNVDVWVSDRQGNPVTGLGADSFEIFHDGEPVPITHFVEVRSGVVASEPTAVQPAAGPESPRRSAAAPSHVVAYFDHSRLHPANVKPLVRGLEDLLSAGTVEPGRLLILQQDRNLSVAAPFGSTRAELLQALEGLTKGAATGVGLESETRLALDAIDGAWEQSQDIAGSAAGGVALAPDIANPTGEPAGGSPRSVVGGVGSGGGPDACGLFVNQVRPILGAWARSSRQRVEVTLANLSDAASFLAGLPGIKVLLYLSDGLDARPGAALATYASGLCPAAGVDLLSGDLSEELTDRFLELTRHANTNRVTMHALQATGLRSPGAGSAASDRGVRSGSTQRSSGGFETRRRNAEREGLSLIARETGGRTVFNRNEFGPELVKIGDESRTYYSLAYEPPADSGAGGGKSHQIEVRVGDGSLDARYRRGYREKDPAEWLTERVEGALNLGITSNPLEVRLGAGAIQAGADGKLRLPLHVMIPVERLAFLPGDGEGVAAVTIKVLARRLETNALAVRDKTFRVKGSPGAVGWADLPVELDLDEGAYLAAIGVQDQVSREASFVSTTLAVAPGG